MESKINNIRQQALSDGILLTSWLEKTGLSRSEIYDYTESGWFQRVATGVFLFKDTPMLYEYDIYRRKNSFCN